jgi:hypothetical protein
MKFERGISPMEAMRIGMEGNPLMINSIEEVTREDSGRMVRERYPLPKAQKLLTEICTRPKSEVLFNLQDREIYIRHLGDRVRPANKESLISLYGTWVSLPGLKLRIPMFLKELENQ